MIKRKPKRCACCGAGTEPLEQFFNQDAGWGLCGPCADWIEERKGAEYLAEVYGQRGVHIGTEEVAA